MESKASSSNFESAQDDNNSESDPNEDGFPKLFYVSDLNSVDAVIRSFECKTNSKFFTITSTGYFGSNWSIHSNEDVKYKIMFEDKYEINGSIPYDGVPFYEVGRKTMGCRFGKTWMAKHLEKRREERRQRGAKGRKDVKIVNNNCPARIVIREIHKFSEFKVEGDSGDFHDQASHLRKALLEQEEVGERRFYICLPRWTDHRGHELTQNEVGLTDRMVVKKMHEFMKQGIQDPRHLQKVTYDYVRNELFKGTEAPPETDCRFFPPKRRIDSHCYRWRKQMGAKENNGLMSVDAGDTTDEKAEQELDVNDNMEERDDDRFPSPHEHVSMGSASAMSEFNAHFNGCTNHMDHIKNILILSGDRRVAASVKKRLGKIVKELENSANIEKKRITEQGTSNTACTDFRG